MEKKIRNLMSAVVPALVLALIGCQGQINYLKARNELNNGVRAFALRELCWSGGIFRPGD